MVLLRAVPHQKSHAHSHLALHPPRLPSVRLVGLLLLRPRPPPPRHAPTAAVSARRAGADHRAEPVPGVAAPRPDLRSARLPLDRRLRRAGRLGPPRAEELRPPFRFARSRARRLARRADAPAAPAAPAREYGVRPPNVVAQPGAATPAAEKVTGTARVQPAARAAGAPQRAVGRLECARVYLDAWVDFRAAFDGAAELQHHAG